MRRAPELTPLIHENFWTVLAYALGRPVVDRVVAQRFQGAWPMLHKSFDLAERRADRALLEMATQLRVLDDEERFSDLFAQQKYPAFGKVIQSDGVITEMHFRDMTNKVIHAAGFEWDLSDPEAPVIVCHSRDAARWKKARIDVLRLVALVGSMQV